MPNVFHLTLLGLLGGIAVSGSGYGQTPPPKAAAAPGDTLRQCQDEQFRNIAGLLCFETDDGWFLGKDSAWAKTASAQVRASAARFGTMFEEPVGRGVVIYETKGPKRDLSPFTKAGAQWTWAWLNAKGDSDLNPHELGHRWFEIWFAKHHPGKKSAFAYNVAYASPAADWIDEAASTAMETDVRVRYSNLKRYYREGEGGHIIPLSTLFTMPHALSDTALPEVDSTAESIQALVQAVGNMRQRIIQADPEAPDAFYGQCRAIIDFLTERTGNQTLLRSIADNDANGATMDDWLKANGARYGLPTTVSELDKEWRSWLGKLADAKP